MSRKNRFIKLTEEQRYELESAFMTGTNPVLRQRCHYILLSDQGHTVKEILSIYGGCRQAVCKWFGRYETGGLAGLKTKKGQGERPILRIDNELDVALVKGLVEEHPQNLNPALAKLSSHLGRPISKRTLTRFLKKLATAGNGPGGFPPSGHRNRSSN